MEKTPKKPEDMKKPLADMHGDGVGFNDDLKAKKERRERLKKPNDKKDDK